MQFSNTPYGCHNRAPFKDTVTIYGEPVRAGGQVFPVVANEILFRGTKDCQYTLSNLGQIDPGCTGCEHRVTVTVVEEPRDHIIFREGCVNDEDDVVQVSIPLSEKEARRFISGQREMWPERTFFIMKRVGEE